MPATTSNGVRIHFEIEGHGPPVVLHHGFLGSAADWRDAGYVEALADRYRIILIDARGHGRSDAPHEPDAYTYAQMAADVIAVLDTVGVARAHYWGYSMGGAIGFRLARGWPHRCRSLILGGAQPVPVAEADLGEMRVWTQDLGEGMEVFIDRLERRQGPLPAELQARWRALNGPALAASLEAHLSEDRAGMPGSFDDLAVPTLLYAGTGDHFARDLPRTAAALPDARAVLFGGLDHVATFLHAEIVPYVRTFLAQADETDVPGQ